MRGRPKKKTDRTRERVLSHGRWIVSGVCVFLAVITWLVFGQTLSHDFINFDDNEYVTKNAQVAERKDVLSGLFFMLTLMAYTHYTRAPDRRRYVPVVVAFALGLMCKPMLVSLPLVLLLLDYWPLQRLPSFRPDNPEDRQLLRRLILEKLPLLGLALASSAITVF